MFRLSFIFDKTNLTFLLSVSVKRIILISAEDIFTAAEWESMYQNGYLHDSPSRFSAELAIYTAVGCQPKTAIYTAAVPEPIQILYTRLPCVHIKSLFTRQPSKSKNRLFTLLPGVYKNRYLHGSRPRATSAICIAAGCIHKTVIYTAAIQAANRIHTLLSGVYT